MEYKTIMRELNLPWLELDIEIPYEEMLEEARAIKHRFVAHRDQDGTGGYKHKGWQSLCIHGLSAEKTNHYEEYGYTDQKDCPYVWTDICDECPVTYNYFKNVFPYKSYNRLRFMMLEPEGYITPHSDCWENKLSPINIALNHPKGCMMKMKDHKGYVPFAPGKSLLLNVTNTHAYVNNSKEDRYHIIVHGSPTKEFEELVIRSYEKNGIK
jgi:hypothetical protein